MGIICNLPSTINKPNDSPPALLIFEKCSKSSSFMDVLRENKFVKYEYMYRYMNTCTELHVVYI